MSSTPKHKYTLRSIPSRGMPHRQIIQPRACWRRLSVGWTSKRTRSSTVRFAPWVRWHDSHGGLHTVTYSPRTLEELSLPADYTHSSSGETLLLWDSSYTTELRRSFLFSTPTNTRTLLEAGHLIIDGTFKSAPQLFTFEKLQMIIQKFDSYPTILDFLKCTTCLM